MKQILMNTDMVRALLEGRKTVTRRAVKFKRGQNPTWSGYIPDGAVLYGSNNIPAAKAPYQPGDILWVRETWGMASDLLGAVPGPVYMADYSDFELRKLREKGYRWRPSIHMPREAARIFLRVTGVRVERLQDIPQEDMLREGIKPRHLPGGCRCSAYVEGCMDEPCPNRDAYGYWSYAYPFMETWDSTLQPKDRAAYCWEANPWVWVVEFSRIGKEEENQLCHD